MTDQSWQPVATALLGSYPSQVAAWGRDAIAAYLAELAARGVTPDMALVAIRSCPATQKFPPSAPELAGLARIDPSRPTFDEAMVLVKRALRAGRRPLTGDYGSEAEMIGARENMVRDAARGMHPLVGAFLVRCGDVSRLADEVAEMLDDGVYAGVRRRELEQRWTQHVEAMEGRDAAEVATGRRRGELARFDPLAVLDAQRESPAQLSRGAR